MLTSKLEAAQKRIQRSSDPHFAWIVHDTAPWSPLGRPLGQCTIALVSTCGLYRLDVHAPFDACNNLGDPSFREIHIDTPRDRLRIAHSHYDHTQLAADVNVAVPLDPFRRLVEEGAVDRLYPWVYSFMGYLPEPRQLVTETAPAVARRLAAEGVDAAFLTPCWPICQQSVGLIARSIEERGIPTVCVVMNRDITDNVKTPRALFVHFPYGAPLGPAGNATVQEAVVRAALELLVGATQPGTLVEAGIEWPDWHRLWSTVHRLSSTNIVEPRGDWRGWQEDILRITIEFCVPWNYTPRATSLVETLVNTFKPLLNEPHPIEEIVLIPSKAGRYEVTMDGDLVYSKAATGQHTTNEYILDQVRARLKA